MNHSTFEGNKKGMTAREYLTANGGSVVVAVIVGGRLDGAVVARLLIGVHSNGNPGVAMWSDLHSLECVYASPDHEMRMLVETVLDYVSYSLWRVVGWNKPFGVCPTDEEATRYQPEVENLEKQLGLRRDFSELIDDGQADAWRKELGGKEGHNA